MASEYDILSNKLQDIYEKIHDAGDARMGAKGFVLAGDDGDNEQFLLKKQYNEILEKMRLLQESQSGGRYRKKRRNSRKHPRTKKHRKSRKTFFGLF